MRLLLTIIVAALLGVVSASASPPTIIPRTNEVASFERIQPVFQSKQIPRTRGDALLALLDGGLSVSPRMKDVPSSKYICDLPAPARLWMELTLTNGFTFRIGLLHDGGLLYLPDGLYVFNKASDGKVAKEWMNQMEADLSHEIANAPKPCAYTLGTADDGGTLSGVARLFYHDAGKWRQIYEANRSAIKNPNLLNGSEKLTIPKLK